jgi:hypothetical protein
MKMPLPGLMEQEITPELVRRFSPELEPEKLLAKISLSGLRSIKEQRKR